MTIAIRAKALCALLPALLTYPAAAKPNDIYDPAQFPELAIEAQLPPIIAELKRTLRDPRSIVDFTICPPQKIKYKGGQPVSWGVSFAFNAKNGFGAYEGLTTYAAVFRKSRFYSVYKTQLAGAGGFDGLANRMITRQMATCPMIPTDRILAMIEGSGTMAPLGPVPSPTPTPEAKP